MDSQRPTALETVEATATAAFEFEDEDALWVPPPEISELEEAFEAGSSTCPDGCVVELSVTTVCEHGKTAWSVILGMSTDETGDPNG